MRNLFLSSAKPVCGLYRGLALPLAACNEQDTATVEQTFGPRPRWPSRNNRWIPTVNVAKAIGWPAGGKPMAANGMAVNAFATGLDHPRTVYVLPNGDVLVAETNAPPKPDEDKGIKGWITKLVMGRAGADTPSANRITLLRDTDGDGVAETKSVFLEGLNSPFGMALVGDDFYVANSDAIMKFPYHTRRHQNHRDRREARGPAGAARINHHWTKDLVASPGRHEALCHRRLQQQCRRERHGGRNQSRRRARSRSRDAANGACSPPACAIRTGRPGSRRAARCGSSSTSATNSATISCPTT